MTTKEPNPPCTYHCFDEKNGTPCRYLEEKLKNNGTFDRAVCGYYKKRLKLEKEGVENEFEPKRVEQCIKEFPPTHWMTFSEMIPLLRYGLVFKLKNPRKGLGFDKGAWYYVTLNGSFLTVVDKKGQPVFGCSDPSLNYPILTKKVWKVHKIKED